MQKKASIEEIRSRQYRTIRQTAGTTDIPEFRLRAWVKQGKVPGFYSASRFYVNVPLLLEGVQEGRISG